MTPLALLRDALPIELAEQARAIFLATAFPHAPYHDATHFQREWPDGGFGIPTHDELYQTDFHAAPTLDGVREIVMAGIVPMVAQHTGLIITGGSNRYYKLGAGGHLRLHKDDYAGKVGFIWYLSKGWAWDWGGLLITLDGESATATLPVFNTLVIIDHGAAVPHLVSAVMPWAQEPRMMVTGILK